jgi:YfiH family protein
VAVVTTRVIDLRGRAGAESLADALGRRPIARAEQVHGARVVGLESAPGAAVPGADGLATRSSAVLLALGADCPGVAILGEGGVAVAHSGWRGAVADVAPNAVDALVAWGEERSALRAFVGPGIGLCCFEVGDEVVAAFESAHGPLGALVEIPGERRAEIRKPHIDLKGAIARRLIERGGLRPENVVVAPECTKCSAEKFFSRRREGPGCGHHAVAAYLR